MKKEGQHIGKLEAVVRIHADELARVNRLLSIKSLEDMSNGELAAQGANTHHNEGVFRAVFDDQCH